MAKQTTTTPCTRTHQIGALALITITFFTTRLLNNPQQQPLSSYPVISSEGDDGWPERGYGTRLDLKVYVYEEDEIDGIKLLLYGRDGNVKADACLKGQWGTQEVETRIVLMADLFFVPSYVKCVRMMGGLNDKEINQAYVKVLSQMPYFRLSGGRDHIFVFPSGAGAHLFKSWATYINRSIILTPEGDRTDKRDTSAFNTWKDIIIPGNVDDGMTSNGLESPELKFSGTEKLGKTDYFLHLRNAKFCLAPRGESSWTLRFYESFFVECVPVLLSDQAELPFQNVVDYSQISIKWPSSRIGTELLEYLESIPDKRIEEMIARGRKLRCLWVYAPDSEPCSAFTRILWELQRKTRTFHQSPETFWLHNGSIVNRDLVEFHKWRPPMPLP
nr:probable glucuronosyltransferase GUT1 [Tanacetum cinerariifolium]